MVMDEAGLIREGARELLDDVEPGDLREAAIETAQTAWQGPGVATLIAARKAGVENGGVDLKRRAVAVQLMYAGLQTSRRLVDQEPWTSGDAEPGNRDVLVADVLVARGGHLLAYTEAVDEGVRVVRAFGERRTADSQSVSPTALEADVLDLAAVAGSTVARPTPSSTARSWARDVANGLDPDDLPEPSALVPPEDRGPVAHLAMASERGGRTDP